MQKWKKAFFMTAMLMTSVSVSAGVMAASPVNNDVPAVSSAVKPAEKKDASSVTSVKKSSQPASSLNSLVPIDGKPLRNDDFVVGNMTFGQTIQDVEKLYGLPLEHHANGYNHQYDYKDFSVLAADEFMYRYMERKDLNLTSKFSNDGVSAVIVKKSGIFTSRHIEVGDSRQSVLRVYGKPDEVLWDGKKNQFYFLYRLQGKQMIFTLREDKVSDFRISSMKPFHGIVSDYKDIHRADALPMKDFKIAGYELNTKFQSYPWEDWIKKMTNAKEDVWYYPGYAVRVSKKSQIIHGLMIEDSQMLTNRGVSVGDDVSTLDLLYGAPAKIELDTTGHSPKSCYIYFSAPKSYMLLFYIDNQKISSIVSTLQPHFSK